MAMETTQVGFRIPTRLLEAVDEHVEWMHEHKPHQRYTRTDAIRELIALGLEAFEQQKNMGRRKK